MYTWHAQPSFEADMAAGSFYFLHSSPIFTPDSIRWRHRLHKPRRKTWHFAEPRQRYLSTVHPQNTVS